MFAVTAAHLVQGDHVSIRDTLGALCVSAGSLVDAERDLAVFEVTDCEAATTFHAARDGQFYANIDSSLNLWDRGASHSSEILMGPAPNRVSVVSSRPVNSRSTPVYVWKNVMGDLVTNLQIYPGMSGSPLFYSSIENSFDFDRVGFNVRLAGVAKASWRFFRFSKLVSVDTLSDLLSVYSEGSRGVQNAVTWVLRDGSLSQELDRSLRDSSLKVAPNGNGISIDSGSMDPAFDQSTAVKNDFELFRANQLTLGMTYQGRPTIAFEVEDSLAVGDSAKSFLVYASLANYRYLRVQSKRFKILNGISSNADLSPWLARQTAGFSADQLSKANDRLKEQGIDLNLNGSLPLYSRDLLQIKDSGDVVWGWDLRNLVMIDLEDLNVADREQKLSPTLMDSRIASAIGSGFLKSFGARKDSSVLNSSLSKLW